MRRAVIYGRAFFLYEKFDLFMLYEYFHSGRGTNILVRGVELIHMKIVKALFLRVAIIILFILAIESTLNHVFGAVPEDHPLRRQ